MPLSITIRMKAEVMTMPETPEERRLQEHQRDLARLRGLRPIDDDFLRCILRDNIPLSQFILRILVNKPDLVITEIETQKDLKRLAGARSICVDAYGTDSEGKKYNLEIQRSSLGAGVHRARYHASSMDIENLDAGQSFSDLPETFTIFVTEEDYFNRGKPVYPIERMNLATGEPFNDGSHILYVNGKYRDDTAIGKLMHDFSCWDPDDMNYKELKEVTRYYKEDPKGVKIMCRAFEETREEGRAEGRAEGTLTTLASLFTDGLITAAQAAARAGMTEKEFLEKVTHPVTT